LAGARGLGGGRVFANLPELETERLLLRKMRLDDAEAMFAYGEVLTLQRSPARRTVLDLLSVGLAFLEVVEEYPAVSPVDPPKLSPEPMPLRAWAVQDDHRASLPVQDSYHLTLC
jgi:RimJ/RimL family protein N-acetyltransferase